MLDEALLVNELHECVKQVALNLILKQRLIHVFHEIGLLAARIHGLDEGGVARRQRRVDHALVHFVRFPMLWPVAWVAEFRQLLLRIDVAAHFARAAHSLTVGTLRPLLLLFRCKWIVFEDPLLEHLVLKALGALAVLRVGLVAPHLLVNADTRILGLQQVLVHDFPDGRRALRHGHHRLLRPEAHLVVQVVLQLLVRDRLIRRRVEAPDQRQYLPIREHDAIVSEEVIQVAHANLADVVAVHAAEHGQRRIVRPPLQVVRHLLQLLKNVQLLHEYVDECGLHVEGQCLVPRNPHERPVGRLDTQVHVLAGQHDLQEVLVAQEAVPLRVVEVDDLLTVTLREEEHVVVPEEGDEVAAVESLLCGPVEPHERAVGRELLVCGAQGLPQVFRLQFAFHDF